MVSGAPEGLAEFVQCIYLRYTNVFQQALVHLSQVIAGGYAGLPQLLLGFEDLDHV